MLQSELFVKKKSSSFTPLQESPNTNPNLDISKVGKRAKEAFLGGHLGNLKQTHINDMLRLPTYQDELKSLSCGAVICKACHSSFARLRSDASPILIIDAEVMLHQIALFENLAIKNAVVLSEVYYRIKALCTNATKNFFLFYSENHRDAYVEEKVEESPNNRTDRAIRVSAHWFQSHQAGSIQILLITNNRDSKKNVIEEMRSLQQSNLPDLVAIPTSLNILKGKLNDQRLSKREVIYPEHKLASEITSGLLHGIYHKGRFRVNHYNPLVSYVNINKTFGGDIVAAKLLCPQHQRTEENSLIVEDVNGNVDEAPRNANIAKAWVGSNVSHCSFGYKEKLELDTKIYLYYSNSGWTQKLMTL